MKWLKISLLIGLIPFCSIAQAPQKIGYQAVIRNANNTVLVSKPIGLKISILTGSSNPVSVYEETQKTNTNAFGLISLQIGGGKVVSGAMNKIDWGKGQFYVKTDIDPEGGSNYILFGITELTSVPYALFAINSGISQETVGGGSVVPGPQGEQGAAGVPGLVGKNGAAGFDGTNGIDGAAGATGPQGAQGQTGANGPQGAQGQTGANGISGSNGVDGMMGAMGAQGIIGITGNTSVTGPQGATGLQGLTGLTGNSGGTGPQGATGLRGLTGLAGNSGGTGPQGAQGEQGPQGNAGLDGVFSGKFNKRIVPVLFETDISPAVDELVNASIFVGTVKDRELIFTLPSYDDLLKSLGEKASNGDIITILLSSMGGTITIIPGTGGSILGPTTVNTGQTRVVYIRFTVDKEKPEYIMY